MSSKNDRKQITSAGVYQQHIDELLEKRRLKRESEFVKYWDATKRLYEIKFIAEVNGTSRRIGQQLTNEILKQIDYSQISNSCFYADQLRLKTDNTWKTFRIKSRKKLYEAIRVACLYDKENTLNRQQMDEICQCLLDKITLTQCENNVIQFDDFYLDEGKLHPGCLVKEMPRFCIDDLTLKDVEQVKELPEEVRTLLLNIAGGDEETLETLCDIISYTFLTDLRSRKRNSIATWIHDYNGEAGKSLLADLLNEIFCKRNIASIGGAITQYNKADVANSLLMMMPEAEGRLDKSVTSFIKLVSSGDSIVVRYLFEDPSRVEPRANLIFCSNEKLSTSEKTNGLLRRWVFLEPQTKLKMIVGEENMNQFVDRLFEKETIRQSKAYFVKRAIEMSEKRGSLVHISKECVKRSYEWANENNSVQAFLHDGCNCVNDYSEIELKHVKELYLEYNEFCEENTLICLGATKFAEQIEAITGLKRRKANVNVTLAKRGVQYIRTSKEEPQLDGLFAEQSNESFGQYDICINEARPDRTSRFWMK